MWRKCCNISRVLSQQNIYEFGTNFKDVSNIQKVNESKLSCTIVYGGPISTIRHRRRRIRLAGDTRSDEPCPFPLLHYLLRIVVVATVGGMRHRRECTLGWLIRILGVRSGCRRNAHTATWWTSQHHSKQPDRTKQRMCTWSMYFAT